MAQARRVFVMVVPYQAAGCARALRIDVEADGPLAALASAWRSALAMRPLLGEPHLDEDGPMLLIAPTPRAA